MKKFKEESDKKRREKSGEYDKNEGEVGNKKYYKGDMETIKAMMKKLLKKKIFGGLGEKNNKQLSITINFFL